MLLFFKQCICSPKLLSRLKSKCALLLPTVRVESGEPAVHGAHHAHALRPQLDLLVVLIVVLEVLAPVVVTKNYFPPLFAATSAPLPLT